MASIFSRIIHGEIPSHKITENEDFFAFLDINPLARGHTLVIPKKEIDYIFNLENNLLSGYLPFCKKVAKAIEKAISCERIGMAVLGLEVPHSHIHLVPINSIHDIEFSRPKLKLSEKELEEIAENIRRHLS